MRKLLVAAVMGVFALSVQAQSIRKTRTNFNAWYMYFGDHKVSKNWGIHLEAQFRRSGLIKDPQQLLLRTGVNYHFSPQAFATAGYGYIDTYPYGEYPVAGTFTEHRIWEQLQLKNQIGSFEVVNRFRLEQRWLHLPSTGSSSEASPATYLNRARLLNRVSLPFTGRTIADRSWYFTVYDELMVGFGKNVAFNVFDQNRAYAAIGYKIPSVGRLEVGYLNQINLKGDGIRVENNHTLQVGLASTLDFLKLK